MAKFVRYALAAVCFAASVGCLALWWRSMTHMDQVGGPIGSAYVFHFLTSQGSGVVGLHYLQRVDSIDWAVRSRPISKTLRVPKPASSFGTKDDNAYFPLWYPALIFALAGVAALRFRRQFSIRAALITVSVVAALLGIAVAL